MQVILTEDVDKLGHKDELVTVKDGYGRNYLVPRGKAIFATKSNVKALEEKLRQREYKEKKIREDAQATADKLEKSTLEIGAKVGEEGRIFGSVNTIQIADAIKKATGFEVDRKNIDILEDNIKTIGAYKATVKVYRDITAEITFEVVEEK